MDGVYQNGFTPANGGPHLNNNLGGTTGDIKLEEQVPYNVLQREKLSFHQVILLILFEPEVSSLT